MKEQSEKYRAFFASLICAAARVRDFADRAGVFAVAREPFAGPGPWSIFAGQGYVQTPDDDPAFLYQDALVALDSTRGIHIGMPSAHAMWPTRAR